MKRKILCVDDETIILNLINAYLSDKNYDVIITTKAVDVLSIIDKEKPDALLVDLTMPEISGFEVLEGVRDNYPDLPAVVISGTGDMSDVIKAQRCGAWDYITKPMEDMEILIQVLKKVFERSDLLKQNREYKQYLKEKVVQRTAELVEANERLKEMVIRTFNSIAAIIEKRDPYTAGHQERVAILSAAIAREMGCDEHEIDGIQLAASVHDIGKISVPQEYLSKPTRLTEIEFELMKQHSTHSYEILKNIPSDWQIAEMAFQHHERLDGSGYPLGLKGDDILKGAYIISVADVVEAISSHRPYRAALGLDFAISEIKKGRGTIFKADVVDACISILNDQDESVDFRQLFQT